MVAEVWLLLAVINGQEVYLDTFPARYLCQTSAAEENFVERAVQIEGRPQCRKFIREKDSEASTAGSDQ
jgi:hypothetical protein